MGNGVQTDAWGMEAEKRSGETIVGQRGSEWGRGSHVLFETVIIMSHIYMLIHRRKIKVVFVGGRIHRDTCFSFFLDKLLRMKLLRILVTFYSLYAYTWLSKTQSHCHLKRIHCYKLCQ